MNRKIFKKRRYGRYPSVLLPIDTAVGMLTVWGGREGKKKRKTAHRVIGILLLAAMVFNMLSVGEISIYASETNAGPIPTISKEGGYFSGDEFTLTIGLQNATSGTYRIGNAVTETYTNEKKITIGSGMGVGDSIRITLTATNGDQTDMKEYTFTKADPAASVSVGGTTSYYADITEALKAVEKAGSANATVTLLKDITSILTLKNSCTLDLNGHTIHTDMTAMSTWGGTNVIIRGNGKVISEQSHAFVVAGKVTLEGGTFISNKADYAAVNVNSDDAELSVTGEDVVINGGEGCGLYVNFASSVRLLAGTYSGAAGTICINRSNSTDITLGSMLGNENGVRYAYFNGAAPIKDMLDERILTGTVTVKECGHYYKYIHRENTETHDRTCRACGYTVEEACTLGGYESSNTGHWKTCTLCGGKKIEGHTIKFTASLRGNLITVSEGCGTCGYVNDAGTISVGIPGNLSYGSTMGQQVTLTSDLESKLTYALDGGQVYIYEGAFSLKELTAGKHKLLITVQNTDASCEVTFDVRPLTLTDNMVTLSGENLSYNGALQKPAVTVKYGDKTLVEGTDYTLTYTGDFTNAGTNTVGVTGKGNYQGSIEKTFTIDKASLTADGSGVAKGRYGAKLSELAVEGLTVKLGNDKVNGTWKLKGDSIPNVGDENKYTAYFTPSGNADNYKPLTAEVPLDIEQADYPPNRPYFDKSINKAAVNVKRSCDKVSLIELPSNWQWMEGDREKALEIGQENKTSAAAEYVGADKGNYKNLNVSIEITRADCEHEHTEIRNKTEAACETEGYSGDTYCTDCNVKMVPGVAVPALGHRRDKGTVTKQPTAQETGIRTYHCMGCGIEMGTEEIPRISGGSTGGSTGIGEDSEESKIDGGSTGTAGNTVETVIMPDGTKVETKTETITNAAGNKVVVTTTVKTDKDGNLISRTEKSVIENAAKDTKAVVTVKTDSDGKTKSYAKVTSKVSVSKDGTKTVILAEFVKQLTEAAGTEDLVITQKLKDEEGKKYTVKVNAKNLNEGESLTLIRIKKDGSRVFAGAGRCCVTRKGVSVPLGSASDYELLNAAEAEVFSNGILKSVRVKKSVKLVRLGKKTAIHVKAANKSYNIKKITYISGNESVATVDGNGKITARGRGRTTIKAKVTLQNERTKVVKMKVRVR